MQQGGKIARYLLCTVVAIVTFISSAPASYWQPIIKSVSHDAVRLVNANGSIWNGHGQLALQIGVDRWQVFNEPIHWQIGFTLHGMRVIVDDQNHRLFVSPLGLWLTPLSVMVDAGRCEFPAQSLEVLGGITRTVKLTGQIQLLWQSFSIQKRGKLFITPVNYEIDANSVRSVISPLPQLGSYKITGSVSQEGGVFKVSTLSGPLLISGQGETGQHGIRFTGEAKAALGMEDQLNGLLLLMGDISGGVAHLHY
ncbi:MAG: type II secretion system protein N [Betaproteobacteria bacterium]|nr:type II secretion system protein N [Betaproteobacteria bacterium]